MYTIRKVTKAVARQRMTIKGFKTKEAMYKFLNSQSDNDWHVNSEPDYYGVFKPELAALKPGTYAYAGGRWHNVKTLDPSILSHI
jgi:hypothetical protein